MVYTITAKELMEFVNTYAKEKHDEWLKGKVVFDKNDKMSRQEVMALFGVTSVTITEWGKGEILHPVFIGNRSFYDRSEVMQFFENYYRKKPGVTLLLLCEAPEKLTLAAFFFV